MRSKNIPSQNFIKEIGFHVFFTTCYPTFPSLIRHVRNIDIVVVIIVFEVHLTCFIDCTRSIVALALRHVWKVDETRFKVVVILFKYRHCRTTVMFLVQKAMCNLKHFILSLLLIVFWTCIPIAMVKEGKEAMKQVAEGYTAPSTLASAPPPAPTLPTAEPLFLDTN